MPVSIALATFNGAPYLREQLDSLLRQQLSAAEIVVSDGGSDDGTLAILQEYALLNKIRIAPANGRLNVRDNFQNAVKHCNAGNLIAFCDQDDVWDEQKLHHSMLRLAEFANSPVPALAYSDLSVVDADLNPTGLTFWQVLNVDPGKENFRSLLFGNIVTGCTILMNPAMRILFEGMPADGPTMHDAWLALIAFSFGSAHAIPLPLVKYRQHTASVTNSTNRQQRPLDRIRRIVGQFKAPAGYLAAEIKMAKTFNACFRDRLNPDCCRILDEFLNLEHAGFIRKKWAAIMARGYRYSRKN